MSAEVSTEVRAPAVKELTQGQKCRRLIWYDSSDIRHKKWYPTRYDSYQQPNLLIISNTSPCYLEIRQA